MFYTFYSYRGGAGRTLALSNVSVMLQRHGLNVVVLDCDLGAPALEPYLFPGGDEGGGSRKGLIDLIVDFKAAMSRPPSGRDGRGALSLPRVEDYLHPVETYEKGSIKLMPAGKRRGEDFESYTELVCRFDWDDFYRNWDGSLFFKWLKQALGELRADVVLLNSPVGISEMGRVCTGRLADAVVIFCPPDRQSRTGAFKLAASLAGASATAQPLVAAAAAGAAGDGSAGKWAEQALVKGPVRIIIIPARVEESDTAAHLRESFRTEFVRDFEPFLPEDKKEKEREYFWNLRVPYVPVCSYADVLTARAQGLKETWPMVTAYDGLVRAMARLAPTGSALYALCEDAPLAVIPPKELEGVEPYRSLLPFYERHSRIFFGRGQCVQQLLAQVEAGGMIAVVGQSGSGKSSLVHAGLLPRVRAGQLEGGGPWQVVILTPDTHPLDKLADELYRQELEPGVETLGEPAALAAKLENEPGSLARMVSHLLRGRPESARVLLVVDQFEELATLSNPAERSAFLRQLIGAVGAGRLTVVFTMRQDFYDEFMEENQEVAAAVGDRVLRLGQMGRGGLREAVTRPAELMGVTFEPGLVDRILSEVGEEPGNLPLLQFALTKLWEGRDGARLTHEVYMRIGGVKGALVDEAERVYASLSPDEKEIAERVFTHLVQLNENIDGPNTRRRTTYGELGEPARPVVKKLADKRLLVAGGDNSGAAPEDSRADRVEVAHEALIQTWPRLVKWLKDDREFMLWRQKLARAVADWKDIGEENEALLRGQLLRNAQGLLKEREADIGEPLRDFIARSAEYQQQQQRERDQQQREFELQRRELVRRRRARLVVTAVALLAVVGSLGYAWQTLRRTQDVVNASTYLVRGSEAEQAGNDQSALENYGKAIELGPELPEPYLATAFIYSRRGAEGDYEKALRNFDLFLDRQPASAPGLNGRGELYRKMGGGGDGRMRAAALEDFKRAVEADPNFSPAWYNRASMMLEDRNYDEAIHGFERAVATAPGFNSTEAGPRAGPVSLESIFNGYGAAYNARGEGRAKHGQTDKAFADFGEAVRYGYGPAHFNLAQTALQLGKYEQAIESFSQALRNKPNDALAYMGRGEAYAGAGHRTHAVEDFDRALQLDPKMIKVYFSRGVAYDDAGDTERAMTDLLRFTKEMQHPDHPSDYNSPEFMRMLNEARTRLTKLGYKTLLADARVSLHYGDPSDRPLAEQVEAALRRAGFRRLSLSQSVSSDNAPLVKFFDGADRDNAGRVRDEVRKVYAQSGNPQSIRYWQMPGGRRIDTYGLIEVWLPSAAPRTEPPSDGPTPEPPPSPGD